MALAEEINESNWWWRQMQPFPPLELKLLMHEHQTNSVGKDLLLAKVCSLICCCVNSAKPSWHFGDLVKTWLASCVVPLTLTKSQLIWRYRAWQKAKPNKPLERSPLISTQIGCIIYFIWIRFIPHTVFLHNSNQISLSCSLIEPFQYTDLFLKGQEGRLRKGWDVYCWHQRCLLILSDTQHSI